MRLLLILFLVFSCLLAYSQYQERIDSLKNHLFLEDISSSKVDVLYEIAWEYRNSTPDSTIKYAQRALDLAIKNNFLNRQAKAFNFIGIAYHYKGDYVNAFDYLSKGLEFAKKVNDSLQYGHSLNTLGRLFMTQGDFVKAYNYFFEAKHVFEALYDQSGLSHCYKSLAELYQNQKNIPKALEMLKKALEIRYHINDDRGAISIINELATLYTSQGNYLEAFKYYGEAKKIALQINDKVNIAEINNGIASIYYDQSKYNEAHNYAVEALEMVEQTDNENLRIKIYLLEGKINLALNNIEKGKYFLLKVIALSQSAGDKNSEMQAYYHLHKMEEAENNIAYAYKYFQQYFDIRKSLEDADKARKIERLESRLEIEKKEKENEILLAHQARDRAIIKQQQIENIGLIIISLIVTIFMVHLWITAKNRRRDNKKLEAQKERIAIQKAEITKQNNKINDQNLKLQKRNTDLAHLNDEKDNLMNIMAHDLKGPFNRIVGLIELIKMSEKNSVDQKKYLQMIKEVSIGGIALIRDLLDVHSYEAERRVMNYVKIDIEDFIATKISDYKGEIDTKKLDVRLNVEHIDADFYSDEMYMSRIMDNLISNAVKFSHPTSSILITVRQEKENIFISVKDHGQGFSEDDKKQVFQKFKKLSARPTGGESSNGLGLAIVKNLVNQLNGEIELVSQKNVGSEFIIRFPLKQHVTISLN